MGGKGGEGEWKGGMGKDQRQGLWIIDIKKGQAFGSKGPNGKEASGQAG